MAVPGRNVPNKKDARRPTELLVLSAVLGVFVVIIAFMGTRDIVLALEFGGVAFIVSLVVLAMLALASKPKDAEQADLAEQNDDQQPRGH